MDAVTRLAERVRRIPPAGIVLAAWLGVMLYGLPGYLPPEAIRRLADARVGRFGDVSAVAWRVVDFLVPGPFGMLALQSGCFALGAYLVLRRGLAARAAAWGTLAVLWWPPVAGTLAVIWPESLATAGLALGAAAVLSDRPGRRIAGLIVLAVAGAILHAGWAIAAVLALLFTWRERRLVPAVIAAVAVAGLALAVASRFPPPAADRSALIAEPALGGSQAYVWFADVHDVSGSAGLIQHDARASHLQAALQPAMRWLGATPLFDPRAYALVLLVLAPLVLRDRIARVVLAAGLVAFACAWRAGHAAELHFALWTCAAAGLVVALVVARRLGVGRATRRAVASRESPAASPRASPGGGDASARSNGASTS
jgi:hypothetical protein